jgi:Cys-tRNA(Pro)/Cys-tRNA(Cys) deacylase
VRRKHPLFLDITRSTFSSLERFAEIWKFQNQLRQERKWLHMPLTNNVTRMLAVKGVAFEAHELPEEKLGGMEAASLLNVDPSHVFKTIVALRPDGGQPVLALVPSPHQLELKSVGRLLGSKKLQLATLAEAERLTGLQAGGISPLALIGKGFEVVIDIYALSLEKIYLSGGQRGLNVSMTPQVVIELTHAKTGEISG